MVPVSKGGTPITDLAPLEGMPLTSLGFNFIKAADLAPLKGMKLKTLFLVGLKETLSHESWKILYEMKSLISINGTPAHEFFEKYKDKVK